MRTTSVPCSVTGSETDGQMNDPRLLLMSSYLVDYPFAERLYPAALEAIAASSPMGVDRHPE